jgi:spore coat protein A
VTVKKIQRAIVAAAAAGGLLWASAASAQIVFNPLNGNDAGAANSAFPLQNKQGPSGSNYQVNYPYPGQCVADANNKGAAGTLFPTLKACSMTAGSFACDAGGASVSQRTAGGWAACGVAVKFYDLAPVIPDPATKFVWEVLNPPDYSPDTTTFGGADFYELGVHEATGFQSIASAGLFPDPTKLATAACGGVKVGVVPNGCTVPNGMQWTGLVCAGAPCACPPDASASFLTTYCTAVAANGKPAVPVGNPLFTPVWGVGQINGPNGTKGGPLTGLLAFTGGPASTWSLNNYIATWPSISIRGKKGTPVVVKWTNEFPNNHVLCPHPEAADWPCAIDRTFMGVKSRIDPALSSSLVVPPDGVNQYGSPQQPDNSWVTHLHGGEIPPSTDGFAEKWFGNKNTAREYAAVANAFVQPPFESPSGIQLKRPQGVNFDTYTYPMVQDEATIWFHDHTLGKTHHNVIAGPAGFFPVKDTAKHAAVAGWTPPASAIAPSPVPLTAAQAYTWLDPVTEARGGPANAIPMYDLFLAIQDRAFNEDGSFNFSNGLGQTPVVLGTPACAAAVLANPAFLCAAPGTTSVTAGVNPLIHPVWVPEYFGDHSLVNGVLWPKATVQPGWYRIRIVDGSDSRCYTAGLQVAAPIIVNNVLTPGIAPAPGTAVAPNLPFWIIANDQGYLKNPVRATSFTMCPGERYELLVNFGVLGNNVAPNGIAEVYLTNSAVAPFPVGIAPTAPGAFQDLNVLMKFKVAGALPALGVGVAVSPNLNFAGPALAGVKSCAVGAAAARAGALKLTFDPLKSNAVGDPLGNFAYGATAGAYGSVCMPPNPALMTDASFTDMHLAAGTTIPTTAIVRQVYLNERVDGVTLMPLGMQLNGVPFEYKVTETPKYGTKEYWMFINLTVDAHPMHPHLVRHQLVSRQNFSVTRYKATLCGSTTCQPGGVPGNEMQVIPDVTMPNALGLAYLGPAAAVLNTAATVEGGFKDVVRAMPNQVTTIVAQWDARWNGASPLAAATPNAPGTGGCVVTHVPGALGVADTTTYGCSGATAGTTFAYETATSGPYVWHCHINSHEDSEMMRTSMVVP